MNEPLIQATKISLIQNPVPTAGQTSPLSSAVDMAGYDGCLFLYALGAITGSGTVAIAVSESDTSGGSYTAITGATATATGSAESNQMLAVDVTNAKRRFLKCQVTQAVGNSILGGGIAIQYATKDKPITQATGAGGFAVAAVSVVNATE